MSSKKSTDNSDENNLSFNDLKDVLLKKAKRYYKPLFNEIYKSRFLPFKNYVEAEEYISDIMTKQAEQKSSVEYEDKKYKPIH